MSGLLPLFLNLFLYGVVFSVPLPVPDEKGREIDLSTAVKLHKQKVMFIDARPEESFNEGHVKGAFSLNVENFDSLIVDFKQSYPDSIPFVLYCSGRDCSDSHDLAELFYRNGYFNIRIFADGFPAWEAAGLPITTYLPPQKHKSQE